MSVSRGGSRRIRQNQPKLCLYARGLAVQFRLIMRKQFKVDENLVASELSIPRRGKVRQSSYWEREKNCKANTECKSEAVCNLHA